MSVIELRKTCDRWVDGDWCGQPTEYVYRVRRPYSVEWSGEIPRCPEHAAEYDGVIRRQSFDVARAPLADLDGEPWPMSVSRFLIDEERTEIEGGATERRG